MIYKGQRYKSKANIPVIAMTSWAAPFTGGYNRVLPAGETFTVANDPPEGATAVYCDPDNYRRLQSMFIPISDRIWFWMYCGFYLCIPLKEIEEHCEKLAV